MTKHIYFECDASGCNNPYCAYCEGGLATCIVCGGSEGELTKECCGYRLNDHELNNIYSGYINYENGKWIFNPKRFRNEA